MKLRNLGVDFICTGDDKRMNIFTTGVGLEEDIVLFLSRKTNLHNSVFKVFEISEVPRNDYGKVQFAVLEKITGNT